MKTARPDLRYTNPRPRISAGERLHFVRNDRKLDALKRQRRFWWIDEAPRSTTHENHCCRPKPRDLLRRRRRPNLARARAFEWDLPF